MTTIIVDGFSPNNKVPGFYGRIISPAGRSSTSLFAKKVLLVGLKGTTGLLVDDTDVKQVFSEEEVDTYAEIGSELACMAYEALKVDGANVYLASVTPAVGAAAASMTITFAGTIGVGDYLFRLGGVSFAVTATALDTATTFAAKVVNAIVSSQRFAFTASNLAGVVTVTCRTPGLRGNFHIFFHDKSKLAAGMTVVAAGGTVVTGGGVPFTGGTGTEDVTALGTTLTPGKYDLIGVAQSDAANLARFKTYINAKAGPAEKRLESIVFATNGTTTAAKSLSTTTLNFSRFNPLHDLNGETHPSRTAARWAAHRAVTEEANPSPRYMNVPLYTAPHSQIADIPTNAIMDSLLNNGVSPITTINGVKVVVRAVTSYCLNGTSPDDRVLDVNQQTMPDYALYAIEQYWDQEFAPNFDRVENNPPDEGPDPVAGVAYPRLWEDVLIGIEREWEGNGWITDVNGHLPNAVFDGTRIMFNAPILPSKGNYQIGGNVRQVSR